MGVDLGLLKVEAKGRWAGIFQRLGIQVGDGRHTACPICGGTDRYRYDDKDQRGTWFCNQCGAGDGFLLVQKVLKIDLNQACIAVAKIVGSVVKSSVQGDEPVSPEILRREFMRSTVAMARDTVGLYLKKRGLDTGKMPTTLRCSSGCWEPETKKKHLAMLAIFSDPEGKALTMHRTWLTKYGAKLDIEKPKKTMPAMGRMTGGACRLYQYESGPIAICEGIETAIAVHELLGMPTWAALSATLLAQVVLPKATEIYVCADNDANFTGQKAAYILANRLKIERDIPVHVHVPAEPGTDFLDELCGNK